MRSALVNIALVIAVLVGSALLTRLLARAMYATCPQCQTLNARRRARCRSCGKELKR